MSHEINGLMTRLAFSRDPVTRLKTWNYMKLVLKKDSSYYDIKDWEYKYRLERMINCMLHNVRRTDD